MAFSINASKWWIVLACALALRAGAQTFVFSTTTDQPATPVMILDEELHAFDASGRWPLLTREILGIAVGDADGDGVFDDQPVDIDAAHASGLEAPGDFHLSVTADFNVAGGALIKDGDIFHFTATGAVIDLPEAFFEGLTGTTQVDVDAFAIAPTGDVYFSFADDETTTNAALIAQNGGSATLDEQCVFRAIPGASAATIFMTPGAVVAAFNHAFGTTATTVVDVCDVEMDPFSPGDILLTSLSTATALRGKVITTFNAGSPFTLAGQQIGLPALGLSTTGQLDALAVASVSRAPVLRAVPEVVSFASPLVASVTSTGWTPGASVQFVETDALLPRPFFLSYPTQSGYTVSPLDPSNPLFLASFSVPHWRVTADATGTATYLYDTSVIPPGITAVVQTVDMQSGRMSAPVSVAFVP
jgi:hypothetical protein